MTFYEVIEQINLPCIYGAYQKKQVLPYISYMGYGQDVFWADNGAYRRNNLYQLIYYYKIKDESEEDNIEETLLDNGFVYDKSEDLYDDGENLYYIVYSNIKNLKFGR